MAQNVGSAESMGSCCEIQRDSGIIDSDLQRGWSPVLSWGRSWEFNSMYLATLWRTCQSQIHICSLSSITYKRVTFAFDDSCSFVWGQQKSRNRERRMQMYKAPEKMWKSDIIYTGHCFWCAKWRIVPKNTAPTFKMVNINSEKAIMGILLFIY